MILAELLRACPPKRTAGRVDVPVTGLRHDSREVGPGDLFFALPGSKTDGNRHAREALAKGAVAIVSELEPPPPPATLPGAWIQVADAADAMGRYADVFFRHPSGAMTVVGVTGTNGKTTTTHLLESDRRGGGRQARRRRDDRVPPRGRSAWPRRSTRRRSRWKSRASSPSFAMGGLVTH